MNATQQWVQTHLTDEAASELATEKAQSERMDVKTALKEKLGSVDEIDVHSVNVELEFEDVNDVTNQGAAVNEFEVTYSGMATVVYEVTRTEIQTVLNPNGDLEQEMNRSRRRENKSVSVSATIYVYENNGAYNGASSPILSLH